MNGKQFYFLTMIVFVWLIDWLMNWLNCWTCHSALCPIKDEIYVNQSHQNQNQIFCLWAKTKVKFHRQRSLWSLWFAPRTFWGFSREIETEEERERSMFGKEWKSSPNIMFYGHRAAVNLGHLFSRQLESLSLICCLVLYKIIHAMRLDLFKFCKRNHKQLAPPTSRELNLKRGWKSERGGFRGSDFDL